MRELFVDNFAGGGGASTGIEMAIGRSVDIAINHSADAIAMHRANHPSTKHYCEDVWTVDPVEACEGNPVALAWFSPDCTHFSRAKGGKPVSKKIRGLAWVAVKWAMLVRPKVIMLENVPEIRTWGPLGKNGKPLKNRSGETFTAFIGALTTGVNRGHPAFKEMCEALGIDRGSFEVRRLIKGLGYTVEYRNLRSCDYGAPTSRNRFYLIARSDGKPIRWPNPTHGPKDSPEVKAGKLLPYRTAAECIDWDRPAPSIFDRRKPLAENTLRRIAKGIQRFVIENPEPFIVAVNHSGDGFRGQSIDEPLQTVTAKHGYGIVTPTIMCNNGGNVGASVESPCPTITTGNRNFLVAPSLIQYHNETARDEVRGQALDEPLMTQDTSNRYALNCAYLMKNYGGGYSGAGSNAEEPLHTVTAKDHNSLVTAHIMTMRNHMNGQAVDEPLTTVSCVPHHAEVLAFLVKYFSNGTPKSVDLPLDTITTKGRFALIKIHGEDYIITDIGMRMLTPRELFRAQGFPDEYVIDVDDQGKPYPKSKQVERCGNAVTPPVPAAMVAANLPEYCCAAYQFNH